MSKIKPAVPPKPVRLQWRPFRFGDLPSELRDVVYDHHFADDEAEGSMVDLEKLNRRGPSPAITFTCHQIRKETLTRWEAARDEFLERHKFWLSEQSLPAYLRYKQPTAPTQDTILGTFDLNTFDVSNVTGLGRTIRRLDRLHLGWSPDRCQTTIVVWEAVDSVKTLNVKDWQPGSGEDEGHVRVMQRQDSYYKRRSSVIVVISQVDMLQGLTGYLRNGMRAHFERMVRCCGFGGFFTPSPPVNWSHEGGIFMLEGSRG